MPEKIELAAPDQAKPGTTEYEITLLVIDVENEFIEVQLKGLNNVRRAERYDNARTMIRQLNTANLSTKSLQKRILEKLLADGRLTGTISGTPDTL